MLYIVNSAKKECVCQIELIRRKQQDAQTDSDPGVLFKRLLFIFKNHSTKLHK